MKVCIECHEEFKFKTSDKGFINQCDDCSEQLEDSKYLGFNDGALNKSTNISVYRGDSKLIRKKIASQKHYVC